MYEVWPLSVNVGRAYSLHVYNVWRLQAQSFRKINIHLMLIDFRSDGTLNSNTWNLIFKQIDSTKSGSHKTTKLERPMRKKNQKSEILSNRSAVYGIQIFLISFLSHRCGSCISHGRVVSSGVLFMLTLTPYWSSSFT